MGTTAWGGKGSKGRAANGDRPVGAARCRRDHHTMASCQPPPPSAPTTYLHNFGDSSPIVAPGVEITVAFGHFLVIPNRFSGMVGPCMIAVVHGPAH